MRELNTKLTVCMNASFPMSHNEVDSIKVLAPFQLWLSDSKGLVLEGTDLTVLGPLSVNNTSSCNSSIIQDLTQAYLTHFSFYQAALISDTGNLFYKSKFQYQKFILGFIALLHWNRLFICRSLMTSSRYGPI